ncbi:hypothetical protein, partial [Burkholderia thailandensis]|uniref:hypothetical protein n=1 Tax=Burkholderia thailandensis TaxID=57975 RepID=UPI000AE67A56
APIRAARRACRLPAHRIASPTPGRALCRGYEDFGKVSADQSLGARRREISTSLRTKTVENPCIAKTLWIVAVVIVDAGRFDGGRDPACARRTDFRCDAAFLTVPGKCRRINVLDDGCSGCPQACQQKVWKTSRASAMPDASPGCAACDARRGPRRPEFDRRRGARRARDAGCCRLFDAFGKWPKDQWVECRMLSLSTSLPTKFVEKTAALGRGEEGRRRRRSSAAGAPLRRAPDIERRGAWTSAQAGLPTSCAA